MGPDGPLGPTPPPSLGRALPPLDVGAVGVAEGVSVGGAGVKVGAVAVDVGVSPGVELVLPVLVGVYVGV